jgi:hypothetical protein
MKAIKDTANSHSNQETMFKGRLGWDGLVRVNVPSSEKPGMLKILHDAGVTHINGKTVEDLLHTS